MASPAQQVRDVFLVPESIEASTEQLRSLALAAPSGLRIIAESFVENLHGVVRTLSIPFQYTYSEVHSLLWQRFHMAERIRARGIDDESRQESVALAMPEANSTST
jgi:hypothetical protein